MKPQHLARLLGLLLLGPSSLAATAGTLVVSSTTAALNACNVARNTAIVVNFDRAVQTASVTESTLRVWGWSGGRTPTTRAWSNGDQTLTITPTRNFFPGERVTVNLAAAITAVDGSPLRAGGYTLQFLTRAGVASLPPGEYRAEVELACQPGDAGCSFEVAFSDAVGRATVPSTGSWNKYTVVSVGGLKVTAQGDMPANVEVRAAPGTKLKGGLMNLRQVRLIRVR